MAFWQQACLKGLVLGITAVAVIASLLMLLFGLWANGGALSDEPFSWRAVGVIVAVTGSQIGLAVIGFASLWRAIDRWSDQIDGQRSLATFDEAAGVEEVGA